MSRKLDFKSFFFAMASCHFCSRTVIFSTKDFQFPNQNSEQINNIFFSVTLNSSLNNLLVLNFLGEKILVTYNYNNYSCKKDLLIKYNFSVTFHVR